MLIRKYALADVNNLIELVEILKKSYGFDKTITEYLDEIQNCYRKPNELTQNYVVRFERLYQRAQWMARKMYKTNDFRKVKLEMLQETGSHTLKY